MTKQENAEPGQGWRVASNDVLVSPCIGCKFEKDHDIYCYDCRINDMGNCHKYTPAHETANGAASSGVLDGGLDGKAAYAYCRWRLGFWVFWRSKLTDTFRRYWSAAWFIAGRP